ncbi:glycine zipper 2TM domain-containing protein [Piscinibacter sakaiensis]|uniref:glycine zipper 2TM domain-containing protein n=1 Tax=Piscinibacter sakaiensis TaxID=1547922 RepID=UPI003729D1B9
MAGAVIGGILGHQIGGGSGRDAATAIGIFGGAVAGSKVNRQAPATQDVQRCTSDQAAGPPSYYDVRYDFRGMEHRVQMTTPPQATVTVNERGEPRV